MKRNATLLYQFKKAANVIPSMKENRFKLLGDMSKKKFIVKKFGAPVIGRIN